MGPNVQLGQFRQLGQHGPIQRASWDCRDIYGTAGTDGEAGTAGTTVGHLGQLGPTGRRGQLGLPGHI